MNTHASMTHILQIIVRSLPLLANSTQSLTFAAGFSEFPAGENNLLLSAKQQSFINNILNIPKK